MTTRPSPSCFPRGVKITPEPVGPTCQLCDNTGHAARSCPTYLNQVSANRAILARLDEIALEGQRQKQRLAETEAQVKELLMDVVHMAELYEDAPKSEQDEERWDEFLSNRVSRIYHLD